MLIGHQNIADFKRREINEKRLHHAQLFIGPKHVGKTRVAIELAFALQDVEENVVARKHIMEGIDSDVLFFLDEGERLPIAQVRGIIERCSQSHSKPYLVVLIENIGRMGVEAANALLKILEEPAEDIIFFLTANQEEDILPTIRSRVQVTRFHTVSDQHMKDACGDHVFADQLVMFAMGRPGKLKRLMNDKEYLEAHQNMDESLVRFLEKPTMHAAFELSRRFEKDPYLQEWLDILLRRARTFALSGSKPALLEHLDFTEVMERVEDSKSDILHNVNKKLTLETLLLPFVA
jgi:hypothetical protein